MKIAIEGQRLFRLKKHGMDMVALELIRNLQEIDHQNQYVIFVKPDEDRGCLKETPNFSIIELSGGPYPTWEQVALPRAVQSHGCDLLHCTSNTAPVFSRVPLVITLHDIIYMESSFLRLAFGGGTPYQRFGNIYRRMIVPKLMRKSEAIITVSEYEKGRIADFFNMSDGRLYAVYNGVSNYFKRITDVRELQRVREKYRLPERFFFFLGNTVPKKNTPGTLKAYADFRKETGWDIPLVMLDYEKDDLLKIANELGTPDLVNHIHLTGYVVNTDLPAIYSLSEIFLYPSFRESFGIPILEAQKCGTPVITSNTSSMPEISGNGSYLINPQNTHEITKAMIALTSDDKLRSEFIKEGLANAAGFSWRAMAERVLGIYENVYEERSRG